MASGSALISLVKLSAEVGDVGGVAFRSHHLAPQFLEPRDRGATRALGVGGTG